MDAMSIGKIVLAALFVFMIIRFAPAAIHQIKHGPKGSTSEWLNALLLIGAVAAFVMFLMSIT